MKDVSKLKGIAKKSILVLLYLVFFVFQVQAQNEKAKARYVYTFTKNLTWQQPVNSTGFVIGVLGSSPITNELKLLTTGKKVGTQSIIVKEYSTVPQIERCNILIIISNKHSLLPRVLLRFQDAPTLIVTEKQGSINQGSCINFVENGSNVKYEYSQHHIESRDIATSPTLFTLGIAAY